MARHPFSALSPLVVVLTLSGCAEIHPGMVVPPARLPATNPALAGAVRVSEVRGAITDGLPGDSQIPGARVGEALSTSLREGGLLSPSPDVARYAVDAEVVRVVQQTRFETEVPTALGDVLHPMSMRDVVVTTTIDYALTDTWTGARLLHRRVEVPYIAWMVDAPGTVNRFRIAGEGSVRESIETMLDAVASLRVPADATPPLAPPPMFEPPPPMDEPPPVMEPPRPADDASSPGAPPQ